MLAPSPIDVPVARLAALSAAGRHRPDADAVTGRDFVEAGVPPLTWAEFRALTQLAATVSFFAEKNQETLRNV